MSEHTPSQAEGERQDDTATERKTEQGDPQEAPRTTPSQAEGDRAGEEAKEGDAAEWESGWSGP
ncbi:hypothetical protein OG828_46085 [Streptomyces sp. NBC_00457]|uniref:hypothetical protein n=1 Tax=Streptomyces sp. NBC_00457 TaxID=2975748 RepID=UPI002E1CEA13